MENFENRSHEKDPFEEGTTEEERYLPDVTEKQKVKITGEYLRVSEAVEDAQNDIEEEYNVDLDAVMKDLYEKSRDVLRSSGLPQDETLLRTILMIHAKSEVAEQVKELKSRGDREKKLLWEEAEKI